MEGIVKCVDCHTVFARENSLKTHVKVCKQKNRKFLCKYCKKLLSSKQNLKEHEFTHTKELPYVCKSPGCGLRFRQGSVLSSHKRIHNTIESYVNRNTYNWIKVISIKLSHFVGRINEKKSWGLQDNVEKIELPLITFPQRFWIDKSIISIEFK